MRASARLGCPVTATRSAGGPVARRVRRRGDVALTSGLERETDRSGARSRRLDATRVHRRCRMKGVHDPPRASTSRDRRRPPSQSLMRRQAARIAGWGWPIGTGPDVGVRDVGGCGAFEELQQLDGEGQRQGGVLLRGDLDHGLQQPQLQRGGMFGHHLGASVREACNSLSAVITREQRSRSAQPRPAATSSVSASRCCPRLGILAQRGQEPTSASRSSRGAQPAVWDQNPDPRTGA
jgi:hypothetical protein